MGLTQVYSSALHGHTDLALSSECLTRSDGPCTQCTLSELLVYVQVIDGECSCLSTRTNVYGRDERGLSSVCALQILGLIV